MPLIDRSKCSYCDHDGSDRRLLMITLTDREGVVLDRATACHGCLTDLAGGLDLTPGVEEKPALEVKTIAVDVMSIDRFVVPADLTAQDVDALAALANDCGDDPCEDHCAEGWYCTRDKGHHGPHVATFIDDATDVETLCAAWPQAAK